MVPVHILTWEKTQDILGIIQSYVSHRDETENIYPKPLFVFLYGEEFQKHFNFYFFLFCIFYIVYIMSLFLQCQNKYNY